MTETTEIDEGVRPGFPVERLVGPSDSMKLERIAALQNAARIAGLNSDWASKTENAKPYLAVIAEAMNEALDEINRCSRMSEGKVDADPWFHMLHWQALIAARWVGEERSRAAIAHVQAAVYSRPNAQVHRKNRP